MSGIPFAKLQGTGNDFVLIDLTRRDVARTEVEFWQEIAPRVCDRHLGVGADGLLLLLASEQAAVRMLIFNADGSEAKMCGNGVRCVGRYWVDAYKMTSRTLEIETLGGRVQVEATHDGELFRVGMGEPRLARCEIPMKGDPARWVIEEPLNDLGLRVSALSMGNPHAVVFVEELSDESFAHLAPLLAHHPLFPEGANAGFAKLLDREHVDLRVWERGSGPTRACGTGACAAVVAGILAGHLEPEVRVDLPGGSLLIAWRGRGQEVYMTGPAERVFGGELSRSFTPLHSNERRSIE